MEEDAAHVMLLLEMDKRLMRVSWGVRDQTEVNRMSQERKHYTAEEKVAVLHKHLVEKVPVSQVCEEYGLSPNVLYRWQKEFFDNGAAVFRRDRSDGRMRKLEQQNEALRVKLADKDEVIAEIMAEHVALKKSLGET